MNKLILQTIIVFVFCGIVSGVDSNVSWIPGDNPQDFSRFPENPTINDIITFIIPTDVYLNRWKAEQSLGGTPTLLIDTVQKRIELIFEPPAPADPIPNTFDPVRGLQGFFGPLEEGSWLFFTQFPGTIYVDPFDVTFESPSPIISGRIVTFDGTGIRNVTVFFSNRAGIAITDGNGNYSKEVPNGWSGTVTPIKSDYSFDPPTRSYTNVTSNKTGQDYEGLEEKPPVNDSLTEQFISSDDAFDLQNKSITFNPTPDETSYTAQLQQISQLPTDPGPGTNLGLNDDDYKFIKLSGSARVSLYGSNFTGLYAGSNGYITLGDGDTAFTDALSNHFSLMRISGLFRDLDPSSGGQISWRQLADRVAVTWQNVPEYNTNNSNTFQIELFFDGTIRISWLGIEVESCIVGLSEGLGIPPDFEETDLSELVPPVTTKYFTEQFLSDDLFDLSNRTILFSPTTDGTFYSPTVSPISQLPTNPVGGVNLGLDDDDSKFVKLSGSATVSIYSNSFSGFYVGSNGYITFTEDDQEYSDTLSNHFKALRVSGLFRDLDPSENGQVSWKQLTDRVVVTWDNVPEYSRNNSNTFQIALFYDGSIRLSWLRIDAQQGIVGLSDGLGVPPDFQDTDFSELSGPPPSAKDYLVEQFISGINDFDLSFRSITFNPSGSGTSYSAEVQQISQLPTNPSGGINLGLGDDDSAFVKLTGSLIVSIYGNSFTGFYVGSNGYITFTVGDEEYSDSLENHFNTFRISGLFHDLDPSVNGQVSWKYMNDRVAVTWENVPEYDSSNPNTFQIEMFFDGRIRMSWLGIAAESGIVGLSDGIGIPPDFQETDLSELSTQPPPPPPPGSDFLTEQFSSSADIFDLSFASVTFTPTSDGTSYVGFLQNITQLPTNPSGGTNLPLRDDNYVQVGLSNQARVKIYNQMFPTFFVGSNGYITFTQPDQDHSETLAEHFETLRISGLYCDLTAANNGTTTGKQLSNRVAITWQEVPEFSDTAPNTFQIEMFYDGRIRISWLEIGSWNNIVGLSNGLGLSPDFVETDFSIQYAQP